MYDSKTLRKQILQAWSEFILSQIIEPRERANRYKTKKIMLRAHGVKSYFDFDFPIEYMALSYWVTPLEDSDPLGLIPVDPNMMGILGAQAEVVGQVEAPVEEEVPEEEVMDEEMFFAQHFTQSLSDAVGGGDQRSSGGFNFSR